MLCPQPATRAVPHTTSYVGVGGTSGKSQDLMGVAWSSGVQELNVCQGKIEA